MSSLYNDNIVELMLSLFDNVFFFYLKTVFSFLVIEDDYSSARKLINFFLYLILLLFRGR
jgi:hypothetical protein